MAGEDLNHRRQHDSDIIVRNPRRQTTLSTFQLIENVFAGMLVNRLMELKQGANYVGIGGGWRGGSHGQQLIESIL